MPDAALPSTGHTHAQETSDLESSPNVWTYDVGRSGCTFKITWFIDTTNGDPDIKLHFPTDRTWGVVEVSETPSVSGHKLTFDIREPDDRVVRIEGGYKLTFPKNATRSTEALSNGFISTQRKSPVFIKLTDFCEEVTPGDFAVAEISYRGYEPRSGKNESLCWNYTSPVIKIRGAIFRQETSSVSNFREIEYRFDWVPKEGTWEGAWDLMSEATKTAKKVALDPALFRAWLGLPQRSIE